MDSSIFNHMWEDLIKFLIVAAILIVGVGFGIGWAIGHFGR